MLKKTIKYVDYNNVEREEDFYFNLTETELVKMDLGTTGGLQDMIQKIISTRDIPSIAKVFEDIIAKSYGEKSADGRRFIKDENLTKEFVQTEAYNKLYMELATDDEAAIKFIEGIIPADLADKLEEQKLLNNN